MIRRRCCGSGRSTVGTRDFCKAIRASTRVYVTEGQSLSLDVKLPSGSRRPLYDALKSFACDKRSSSGVWLAHLTVVAWNKGIAKSNFEAILKKKTSAFGGSGLPLHSMRTILYDIVGKCTECRGKACTACAMTGLRQ